MELSFALMVLAGMLLALTLLAIVIVAAAEWIGRGRRVPRGFPVLPPKRSGEE